MTTRQAVAAAFATSLLLTGTLSARASDGPLDQIGGACQILAGSQLGIAAFTTVQLVDPLTNLKGVIVRSIALSMKAGAAGNVSAALVAGAAAPTGFFGANQLQLANLSDFDQLTKIVSNFDMHKRLPIGWGVWFGYTVNGAAAVINSYAASLEVLT